MRYAIIYLILLTTQIVFASDLDTAKYSIPVNIVDSMFFEIQQGRQCAKLSVALTNENLKLETELLATGKIILLKNSEVTHLEDIITALQQQADATRVITKERLDKFRARVRKLTVLVIGEAGIIILLIVVLL